MNEKKKPSPAPNETPVDPASTEMAEVIARAMRDAIYGKAMDTTGWETAKPHWMRDAGVFLSKLEALGYVVVKGQVSKEKTFLAG